MKKRLDAHALLLEQDPSKGHTTEVVKAYLEEYGGTHWDGDCFVFDQRVALDYNLRESEIEMCFRCREPLSLEEQGSEHYVIGEKCPYCANI